MLKDIDDRKIILPHKKGKQKMQTFKAKVECTTTITGTDRDDAYKALLDWLEGNEQDYKIISFEPMGDAW